MMLLWAYVRGLDAPRKVWVEPVSDSDLAPIGEDLQDFTPIESRILRVRFDMSAAVVGTTYFLDDRLRPWWVIEIKSGATPAVPTDVAVSRYDFRQGLGYDIPARVVAPSEPYNLPPAWMVTDAGGRPVQVVRAYDVTIDERRNYARFRLYKAPGDIARTPSPAQISASQRSRGARHREGDLFYSAASNTGVDVFNAWWGFSPDSGDDYQLVPLTELAAPRGADIAVDEGDFFVINPA